MLTRRTLLTAAATAAVAARAGAQSVPQGYPGGYADVIAKAKQEGKLAIYTSTDQSQGASLVEAFKAAYPGIAVEWNDMGTTSVFNRIISEAAAKQVGGDVAWSSAVDLQLSIAERQLAQVYVSPEAGKLPAWVKFKDMVYGTTLEPAAVLYNKRLLPAEMIPKTHADLTRILRENKAKLDGKVCTYDPEKSGTGYMFASHNMVHVPNFWEMATAFGAAKGKVYGGSGTMREKITSGEHVLGFDVIGSYANDWAKADANLGVAYLADYVPAFSRAMLICKGAPHPNAAMVFTDFVLSPAGQSAMNAAGLGSIRTDVPNTVNPETLDKTVGGKLSPIALDDKLLAELDPKKRAEFFRGWKKAMQG
jgi:iron(III) transport system substrate-binding protein